MNVKDIEKIINGFNDDSLTYETYGELSVECFYKGISLCTVEVFGNMRIDYTGEYLDLNDIKNSDNAYRLLYASDIMLRAKGLLMKEED